MLLILTGVLLLSLFWEFYLEDLVVPHIYQYYHPEPLYERVEFIITAMGFSTLALVIPAAVALRNIKAADQAREALSSAYDDLEQRVQHRTRELVDVNRKLESAIADRLQSEEALRKSEKELRLLSSQLLTAQENERRRVALDIHDNVSQTLVAMKFRIEHALNESVDNKSTPSELSRLVVPAVQETIEAVRNIYMRLRPSMLDDLGLAATLTWLRRDFQDTHPDIDTRIDVAVTDSEITDNQKIVIYRVVQEALENVARHSKADQVRVSLDRNNNSLQLTVQDNGTGFRLEEVMSVDDSLRGMGLTGMRERIELIGGTFTIASTAGEGTTIRASLPLQQRQSA
jgi:signal transduction histidine kinase